MLIFDERHAPLIFALSWGEHDAKDLDLYVAKCAAWFAEKKRCLVLTDPRAQPFPNAAARKRYAQLGDTITTELPGIPVANAAVLGSALFVGAARAVGWLRRNDDTTHYSQTAAAALAWLEKRGAAEGLVVPAGARELAKELDAYARAGRHPQSLLY